VGYITPLADNIAKALDGSFEVVVDASKTDITADWTIFYNAGTNPSVSIYPKGFTSFANCNLHYLAGSSVSADPTFYALTTSGC
jgi:MSHA pilin protein MshA